MALAQHPRGGVSLEKVIQSLEFGYVWCRHENVGTELVLTVRL